MKKDEGIYAYCDVCGQPIFEHMEKNKEIYDETDMCGVCATGESATYTDEL